MAGASTQPNGQQPKASGSIAGVELRPNQRAHAETRTAKSFTTLLATQNGPINRQIPLNHGIDRKLRTSEMAATCTERVTKLLIGE